MIAKTQFGSIGDYDKGRVEIIDDDPRNYVFSNVFEVAAKALPYERVAVGKNFEYVIEVARAEGRSPWFTCAHDEFALAMEGGVEVQFLELDAAPEIDHQGARVVEDGRAAGRRMGRVVLGLGHMALLPARAAYRFISEKPVALIIQTVQGPLTQERWAQICQTEA